MSGYKMKGGYFVVCDGLDCAGKTTSILRAMEYFKEDDYPVLYSKGLKSNTVAGKFSSTHPSTFSLLSELLYLDLIRIRPNLRQGKTMIQDRWHYSVLSHNPENLKDQLLEKIFTPYLSKPDLFVYFTVSIDERIRRLKKAVKNKDKNINHAYLLKNPTIIEQREEKFSKYYRDFLGDKILLDTTNLSEEESGYKLYESVSLHLK